MAVKQSKPLISTSYVFFNNAEIINSLVMTRHEKEKEDSFFQIDFGHEKLRFITFTLTTRNKVFCQALVNGPKAVKPFCLMYRLKDDDKSPPGVIVQIIT